MYRASKMRRAVLHFIVDLAMTVVARVPRSLVGSDVAKANAVLLVLKEVGKPYQWSDVQKRRRNTGVQYLLDVCVAGCHFLVHTNNRNHVVKVCTESPKKFDRLLLFCIYVVDVGRGECDRNKSIRTDALEQAACTKRLETLTTCSHMVHVLGEQNCQRRVTIAANMVSVRNSLVGTLATEPRAMVHM